jgi:hypothetical protein
MLSVLAVMVVMLDKMLSVLVVMVAMLDQECYLCWLSWWSCFINAICAGFHGDLFSVLKLPHCLSSHTLIILNECKIMTFMLD